MMFLLGEMNLLAAVSGLDKRLLAHLTFLHRQHHRKGRPWLRHARHFDSPAVRRHQIPADHQPEPEIPFALVVSFFMFSGEIPSPVSVPEMG
jgi:hypothetical protein